eukprot:m.209000 g.209000  ORF g.209000 m.209000 type:complete len:482 (-) comp33026_c0_seq9:249-1694(-)
MTAPTRVRFKTEADVRREQLKSTFGSLFVLSTVGVVSAIAVVYLGTELHARFEQAAISYPSSTAPQSDIVTNNVASTKPLTGELEQWKGWLQAHRDKKSAYPKNRFKGRGIVMSAGGRMYFTSVYVTIRTLREVNKCTLPIEVFYHGNDELPHSAIEHMTTTYNVKFIDITTLPAAKGINLRGYQMKAFSLYLSSFEEALWLDSDNIPLKDPSFLFDTQLYLDKGALFWPDFCNMISVRRETFGVFGFEEPAAQPQPRTNKTTIWSERCFEGIATELETGQVLLNKKRSWQALRMILYINKHHDFFLKRLFHGDKMTFHWGFVAAGEEYAVVPYPAGSLGIQAQHKQSTTFCGNTMAQRNPDDGSLLFMHRTMAKYKDAGTYTSGGATVGWRQYALQEHREPWMLMYRDELPSAFFLGTTTTDHYECAQPRGSAVRVVEVADEVKNLEKQCLGFLVDLENLVFYPKDRKCTAESMFFCKHP